MSKYDPLNSKDDNHDEDDRYYKVGYDRASKFERPTHACILSLQGAYWLSNKHKVSQRQQWLHERIFSKKEMRKAKEH